MALDDPLDEHEQGERVLEWLRRNGAALVGGVALGLAVIVGWQWWQRQQEEAKLADAQQYQQAVDAVAAGDASAAAKVNELDPGIFSTLASLELARSQVAAGDSDSAVATLRSVRASDPALAAIVEQRLARLLIDGGKAKEALERVGAATTPSSLEIQGDAHYALGDADKAREAYMQALGRTDVASPQRRILELKLVEVGGTPPSTEARI